MMDEYVTEIGITDMIVVMVNALERLGNALEAIPGLNLVVKDKMTLKFIFIYHKENIYTVR